MDHIKVAILLPAYNEESSIRETIVALKDYFPYAVYVIVDNNSTDNTSKVAKEVVNEYHLKSYILFEEEQGKANAFKLGTQRIQSDVWIMTDADNTYSASALYNLYISIITRRADHGVADRLSNNTYINENKFKTHLHKFGNKLITNLLVKVAGSNYRDVLSGGRVFSSAFIDSIVIESKGFELESELNLKAAELGVKTIEVPTEYSKRKNDNPSKLSPFKDGYKIIAYIFSVALLKRPDRIFLIFAMALGMPGMGLAVIQINYYLNFGNMPYASTSVASAILILGGFQSCFLSLYMRTQRNNRIENIKNQFNERKRKWNEKIDLYSR